MAKEEVSEQEDEYEIKDTPPPTQKPSKKKSDSKAKVKGEPKPKKDGNAPQEGKTKEGTKGKKGSEEEKSQEDSNKENAPKIDLICFTACHIKEMEENLKALKKLPPVTCKEDLIKGVNHVVIGEKRRTLKVIMAIAQGNSFFSLV